MTDEDIERVARQMAIDRGLEPDEIVAGGVNSFGPHDYHGECLIPDVAIYDQRWRLYWYEAKDMISRAGPAAV